MLQSDIQEVFPLSKTKSVHGSRRLAREKALQVLNALEICETPWNFIFSHTFFRKFNFDDEIETDSGKLLTPEEITELEADIKIDWDEDDIIFARSLIQSSIELKDYVDGLIKEYAENWELDRIAMIDKLLMLIAVAELLHFPEIPPKVSINEAIEIAKKYSTSKSGSFINGVLDSLHERLKSEGKINKTGRGLVNS